MSTYKSTDQTWLSDSLNWEKTSNLASADWSLVSFIFQSSFTNQHLVIDQVSKASYLDSILIQSNNQLNTISSLYLATLNDVAVQTNTHSLPFSPLLQSEYTEVLSTALLVSPELSIALDDYFSTYWLASTFNTLPAAVFDSYTNNLNYYPSEGLIAFILFSLYVWFIVYFFTTNLSLR